MEDFTPPVNPPKEIDDPEDSKPADWVDTKKIADPKAVKVGILLVHAGDFLSGYGLARGLG